MTEVETDLLLPLEKDSAPNTATPDPLTTGLSQGRTDTKWLRFSSLTNVKTVSVQVVLLEVLLSNKLLSSSTRLSSLA